MINNIFLSWVHRVSLISSLSFLLLSGCTEQSSPMTDSQQSSVPTSPAVIVDATPSSNVELLAGMVTDSEGNGVGGAPVRAHRQNSNITSVVYTNADGEYSFPECSFWDQEYPHADDV